MKLPDNKVAAYTVTWRRPARKNCINWIGTHGSRNHFGFRICQVLQERDSAKVQHGGGFFNTPIGDYPVLQVLQRSQRTFCINRAPKKAWVAQTGDGFRILQKDST